MEGHTMPDRDPTAALAALDGVHQAHGRLTARELATTADNGDPRGVNGAGFQTYGDLAAVLMVQGQNGTHAEQVLATTSRALLAALAAAAAEAAGQTMQARMQLAETNQLLADAYALSAI